MDHPRRAHEVRPRTSRAAQRCRSGDLAGLDRAGELVFPGQRHGRPLSDMALLMLLRRMGRDVTAHGFRSAFSDWCAEQTNTPSEVREMALAHAVGDKVEAAYRRGDLFDKRRQLADAWAAFCSGTPADNVAPRRADMPC